MKTKMIGCVALAVGLLLAPTSAYAHPGHSWLAGAAQPLLGLDHFLAAMTVAVTVGVGLMVTLRRGARTESDRRS